MTRPARTRRSRFGGLPVVLLALVLGLAMGGSAAAPPQVAPRVAARPLVIGVFGDSLADGLWAGLSNQLRDGRTCEVVRFSRAATGLARYDYVNVEEQARRQLAGRPIDIAVVMVGANDEQGILDGRHALAFDTPPWRAVYAGRIGALVATLRQHGAAVYWVGLPKMRNAAYDEKAQRLNALYAAGAQALGVPFIPTVPATLDAQGRYSDHLLDEGARPRLMRARDGIHMTMAGYLRVAAPVSDRIRADFARTLATRPAPG